jgi:hypothetical protein
MTEKKSVLLMIGVRFGPEISEPDFEAAQMMALLQGLTKSAQFPLHERSGPWSLRDRCSAPSCPEKIYLNDEVMDLSQLMQRRHESSPSRKGFNFAAETIGTRTPDRLSVFALEVQRELQHELV